MADSLEAIHRNPTTTIIRITKMAAIIEMKRVSRVLNVLELSEASALVVDPDYPAVPEDPADAEEPADPFP